jgi:multiple sugar transport system permease protein
LVPLAVYATVVLLPILISVFQSFTNASITRPQPDFVGIDNYTRLVDNEAFHTAALNTVIVTAIVTIIPNGLGIALALLLDRPLRLYAALRAILFIPVILSSVVVSFIWQSILTEKGVLNQSLDAVGLGFLARGWLQDPTFAIGSIGVVVAWSMVGFCVVTYLGALQTIPLELSEAARIDGASKLQAFRYVVWPGVAPALTLNTVVLMISGFKLYDHVVVLTGGGPAGATETAATLILKTSFQEFRTGAASAISVVLLVFVMLATFVALRLLQRREVQA